MGFILLAIGDADSKSSRSNQLREENLRKKMAGKGSVSLSDLPHVGYHVPKRYLVNSYPFLMALMNAI